MKGNRKMAVLLMLLGALAVMAWLSLDVRPAYALAYCNWNGTVCAIEGYSKICWYEGCCGYIGTGTCTCSGGYWNCPDRPECPPDFCP